MAVMRTFDAKDYNKEEMVDYIEQIIIAAIWTTNNWSISLKLNMNKID